MDESILNLLLYLGVWLFYIIKNKRIDLFVCILTVYTLTAFIGVIDYQIGVFTNEFDLSFFRSIYLFAMIMISIKPYSKADFTSKPISIADNKAITILLYFFLVCGVVSAYFTLPKAMMLQAAGDWGALRLDIYAGDSSVTLYDSQFERLAKNFYSYLQPFGSVMAFYQLSRPKINKYLTVALFAVWLTNAYVSATLVASRGLIMLLAMKMLILYIIFRNKIPHNRKKIIVICTAAVGVFFYGYTMAVTESRFGDESSSSLYYYFGHSLFAFNDGIMRTMHDYAGGKYQFGWLFRMFGMNSDFNWHALGCTHGTAFMTYVGNIYVDFGPYVTPIVIILMSLLVNKFTTKKLYRLSDMIIIAFTSSWFLEGVFVFAGDQSLQWFMMFVVYYIIRNLENKPRVI